jgi:hypothetical protein
MSTDDHLRGRWHDRVECRHGILRLASGEIDRDRLDAAIQESRDERLHAGGRTAGTVPQEAAHAHAASLRLAGGKRTPAMGHLAV